MSDILGSNVCQYLTFQQRDDIFGIDIRCIKELLKVTTITALPRSSEFMRGVIDLRGQVVPVIDLKLKFGFDETKFTVDTCIIILEVQLDDGEITLLGALADSVKEVIELSLDDIAPPPKVGASVDSAFIYGIGKFDNQFVVILDALKLCNYDEMALIQNASNAVSEKTSASES